MEGYWDKATVRVLDNPDATLNPAVGGTFAFSPSVSVGESYPPGHTMHDAAASSKFGGGGVAAASSTFGGGGGGGKARRCSPIPFGGGGAAAPNPFGGGGAAAFG